MANSTHFDFDCEDVDSESFTNWEVLGVELRTPEGEPIYWPGDDGEIWKQIGSVTVHDDGRIHLFPFEGLSGVELDRLRGAGMEAFQNKPCEATQWIRDVTKCGRGYWGCVVSISLDADDPMARTIRAAEDQMDLRTRRVQLAQDRIP